MYLHQLQNNHQQSTDRATGVSKQHCNVSYIREINTTNDWNESLKNCLGYSKHMKLYFSDMLTDHVRVMRIFFYSKIQERPWKLGIQRNKVAQDLNVLVMLRVSGLV